MKHDAEREDADTDDSADRDNAQGKGHRADARKPSQSAEYCTGQRQSRMEEMKQIIRKEEKNLVRVRMKRMRRSFSEDAVLRLSAKICERLLSMKEIQQAETIFLYAAVSGEVKLDPLMRALPPYGTTLVYPRVRGDEMDFYEVRSASGLLPGAFGIPEPAADARLLFPASDAVILVPGVAFMENGSRIGMGGGYYDRYLAQYPSLLRIGIAYEAQLEAVWEPDEYDLPMHFLVTEKRTIRCSRGHLCSDVT